MQLRRELAAASGHSGEDGEELPCGTEDITDPAKVLHGGWSDTLAFPGARAGAGLPLQPALSAAAGLCQRAPAHQCPVARVVTGQPFPGLAEVLKK